jgi:hypothetical protein
MVWGTIMHSTTWSSMNVHMKTRCECCLLSSYIRKRIPFAPKITAGVALTQRLGFPICEAVINLSSIAPCSGDNPGNCCPHSCHWSQSALLAFEVGLASGWVRHGGWRLGVPLRCRSECKFGRIQWELNNVTCPGKVARFLSFGRQTLPQPSGTYLISMLLFIQNRKTPLTYT